MFHLAFLRSHQQYSLFCLIPKILEKTVANQHSGIEIPIHSYKDLLSAAGSALISLFVLSYLSAALDTMHYNKISVTRACK